MKLRNIALGLGAGALALGGAALAAEEEMMEVVSYSKFIEAHPYQASVISRAGALAVASIGEARHELGARHYGPARRDAGRALEAMKIVQEASPALRLDEAMGGLHSRLTAGQGANPEDLAPIYTDLQAYAQVTAAADVQVKVDAAKGKLAAGQTEEAAVLLEQARTGIQYMEVDLPIRETSARVSRALTQMRQKDYLAADASLREAQDHIMVFARRAAIEVDKEIMAVGAGPN